MLFQEHPPGQGEGPGKSPGLVRGMAMGHPPVWAGGRGQGHTSDLGGGGAVGSSERVQDGGGEDSPAQGMGSPKRWLHCTSFHLQAQRYALWDLNERVVTFMKHPQNSEIHMTRMLPAT